MILCSLNRTCQGEVCWLASFFPYFFFYNYPSVSSIFLGLHFSIWQFGENSAVIASNIPLSHVSPLEAPFYKFWVYYLDHSLDTVIINNFKYLCYVSVLPKLKHSLLEEGRLVGQLRERWILQASRDPLSEWYKQQGEPGKEDSSTSQAACETPSDLYRCLVDKSCRVLQGGSFCECHSGLGGLFEAVAAFGLTHVIVSKPSPLYL